MKKDENKKCVRISFDIDAQLHYKLKLMCLQKGITMKSYIIETLKKSKRED